MKLTIDIIEGGDYNDQGRPNRAAKAVTEGGIECMVLIATIKVAPPKRDALLDELRRPSGLTEEEVEEFLAPYRQGAVAVKIL